MAYFNDEENSLEEPILYYESVFDDDEAFTICAHYKHGFLFKDENQDTTPKINLVEVTHPSDESISLMFPLGSFNSCDDFHKLAEPLNFKTEQEYIDLRSTSSTWMQALFNDSDASFAMSFNQEKTNNSKSGNNGNNGNDGNNGNNNDLNGAMLGNSKTITDICILRATSGWKNIPYKRLSESDSAASDHIQISMIKKEMTYSEQFAFCESMGATLPYLSNFTQVAMYHALIDSQLNEYETFSTIKPNHLFNNEQNIIDYDIGIFRVYPSW